MKHFWLNKKNNDSLIVFFNGWGMDQKPFSHLDTNNFDVLIFYDYNSLNIEDELIKTINEYSKINIIAWSMGVWVANFCAQKFNLIKRAIAINGTLKPIDDNFGIPQRIFDITARSMSEPARKKFFQKMFINPENFERFLINSPDRDIENQSKELKQLKKHIEQYSHFKNIFDSAIISNIDKIIPTQNQKNYWQQNEFKNSVKMYIINDGHYIFYQNDKGESWKNILNYD